MPTPQFSDQSPTVWCAVAYQQLAWHFKLRSDWASQAAVGSMQLFVSLSVWLIGSRYGLTQVVAGTASCWHSHGFSTFCQAASKSKSGKFFSFSGEGWKNSTSYGWICLHFVYPKWKMGWLAPSGASEWRGGSTIFNHAAWVLSCQFDLCKLLQPCFPMFSHFWSACHGEVKSELPSRAKTRSARSARTRLRRNSKNFRENGNCRVQPVYILILFNIVASCWLFYIWCSYIYICDIDIWDVLNGYPLCFWRKDLVTWSTSIYIDDPWLHRLCQTIQCTPRPVFVTSPLRLFVNWLHVNESMWRWGGYL